LYVPALDEELRDAGVEAWFAPGRTPGNPVDVALVALRADVHDRLRPLAAGVERVAADDTVGCDDVLFLCGFPAHLSFPASPTMHKFTTISYSTGITGKDKHGRLEVYWKDSIPYDDAKVPPHVDMPAGKVSKLGPPRGVSGGGLWRVQGSKKGDLIWSPSSHASLVGVPVAWDTRQTEYAESVNDWGAWLRQVAEHLE
jgi:hypothetical protein